MNFNSYIVSETKTALSVPVSISVLPPKKTLKQKAFTLAEVLITLSIIGVVAAMTVPTLMANANKQIYTTKLKKVYSTMQNAVKMMPLSVGCSAGEYSCVTIGQENHFDARIFADQFKVVKDFDTCKIDYTLPQSLYVNSCFQLEDGTTFFFRNTSSGDIYAASIGVDLNGEKGPNKIGRDIFMFQITSYEKQNIKIGTVMPYGSKIFHEYSYVYWKDKCTDNTVKQQNWDAIMCAGRVLEEGKMNY